MNTTLRGAALVVVGAAGLFAVFTFVSSLWLMWSTNQLAFFVFPFNQWWFLFFKWWGRWQLRPWIPLCTAAIFGLLIPIIVLKLTLQRAGFFTPGAGFRIRMGGRP